MSLFNKRTLATKECFRLEYIFKRKKYVNNNSGIHVIMLDVPVESELGKCWIKAVESLDSNDIKLKYIYANTLELLGIEEMKRVGKLPDMNNYFLTMPFDTVFPCRQCVHDEFQNEINRKIESIEIITV